MLTDNAGPVRVEVPRDRDATFTPVIVAKRQRRLSDVDAVVLSLYAKGLTTGEISAHFAEVYGASVSKDTVSRITDQVLEDMQAWTSRPLLAGCMRRCSSTPSTSRSATASGDGAAARRRANASGSRRPRAAGRPTSRNQAKPLWSASAAPAARRPPHAMSGSTRCGAANGCH